MKVIMNIHFEGMEDASQQSIKDTIAECLETACIDVESIQIEE